MRWSVVRGVFNSPSIEAIEPCDAHPNRYNLVKIYESHSGVLRGHRSFRCGVSCQLSKILSGPANTCSGSTISSPSIAKTMWVCGIQSRYHLPKRATVTSSSFDPRYSRRGKPTDFSSSARLPRYSLLVQATSNWPVCDTTKA